MVDIYFFKHKIPFSIFSTILLINIGVFLCRCILCIAVCIVVMHGGVACCPGNSLPDDISCLAADRMLVFAAAGTVISAFARNKEVGGEKKNPSISLLFIYFLHNLTQKRKSNQVTKLIVQQQRLLNTFEDKRLM